MSPIEVDAPTRARAAGARVPTARFGARAAAVPGREHTGPIPRYGGPVPPMRTTFAAWHDDEEIR